MPPEQGAKIGAALRSRVPDTKKCPACKQTLARTEFKRRGPNKPVKSLCKSCERKNAVERFRRYVENNREAVANTQRWIKIRKRYNITQAVYEAILARQDGKCALCRRPDLGPGCKRLHVDHDHETGAVRGLLCPLCNRALARFGDNAEGLARALAYVTGPHGGHEQSRGVGG